MTGAAEPNRALPVGIVLPTQANPLRRRKIDRAALDEALEAGRFLGFVSRDPVELEPGSDRRRPGPRRREPQDRLSVPGPRRITAAFRRYCTTHGLTHWEGMERLLERSDDGRGDASEAGDRTGIPKGRVDPGHDRARHSDVTARSPGTGMVRTTVSIPVEMRAWIEARGNGARYGDASDYVRDVIRRDQEQRASAVEIEAALDAGLSAARDDALDLAEFIRQRRNGGRGV